MEHSSLDLGATESTMSLESVWRPKLLLSGSKAVGKTALVKLFCGEEFPQNYQMTTAPQLFRNKITFKDGEKVEPFVFDFPSDEAFERHWDRVEAEADAHVFVYDVTRTQTLKDVVNKWTLKLRNGRDDPPPALLIGNKMDLTSRRVVSGSEGAAVAESIGAVFVETSAKDNHGVLFRGGVACDDDYDAEEDGVEVSALGDGLDAIVDGGAGSIAAGVGALSDGAAIGECVFFGVSEVILRFLRRLEARKRFRRRNDDGNDENERNDKDLIMLETALNIS